MVRSLHKNKVLLLVAAVMATPTFILSSAHADVTKNINLQVNVEEVLTVTVTDPTTWASGDLSYNSTTDKYESDFLRNKVTVEASTNNPIGVTVSMYTNNTRLQNLTSYSSSDETSYIPTLASATTRGNFPINYWGYSVDDTTEGSNASNYGSLPTSASPVELFSTVGTASVGSGSEDVYFGTKANNEKQSGTYAQTVYFAAVTGTINNDPSDPHYNPIVPQNPSTPDPVDEIAFYSSTAGVGSNGQTTYTTRTRNTTTGNDTTSTQVTSGDVRSSYAHAAGVTTTDEGINVGALAAALGVSAAVAAGTGFFLFAAAKRRKDDDEEEQQK